MFHIHSLARTRARLALGAVVALASLATGCVKPLPDQSGAKLTITATQPTGTYQPGDDVTFRVTVTNAGTQDVSLLEISSTLATGLLQRSLACSPLGAAASTTGDAPCSTFIYLKTLAAGASVTLDFDTAVAANATGTLTSNFEAGVNSGPTVTTTNQTTLVDQRGGNYTAFTSDGQRVALAADFGARKLTFGDGSAAVALPFTPQATATGNLFDANTGFLAHPDLLAGNAPLDGATPVFLAARNFVTSAATLEGHTFTAFGVTTPATGSATSDVESIGFSGGAMQACVGAGPSALATCPAGSLRTYALGESGGVFTAVDAADNDTRTFQVAQSGGTLVFLRAEPVAGGAMFQVGLSTNSGVVDNVLPGGDNTGRWGQVAFMTGGMEESFGPVSVPLGVVLQTVPGQPAGLANSMLASGTRVYVVEDGNIALVEAADGSGLIQAFAR